MNEYRLTPNEIWALATILYLPVESGSVLAKCLSRFPEPNPADLSSSALNRLEAKGYLRPNLRDDLVPADLLEALAIAALSPITLTAALRRNGRLAWTHFTQLDDTLVQYMPEDNALTLHPPTPAHQMAVDLIPDWFTVTHDEGFQAQLPFGAFLLLVTACQLYDTYAAISETAGEAAFDRGELVDAFMESRDWMDIYSALELPGIPSLASVPLNEYLNTLTNLGYLEARGADDLTIGLAAHPFQIVYSDPDMCNLTLSLQTRPEEFPRTGALVAGSERLLLAEFERTGTLRITQLQDLDAAQAWARRLLAHGEQVRVHLSPPPEPVQDDATRIQSQPKPRYCPRCGAAVNPHQKFCTRCGNPMRVTS